MAIREFLQNMMDHLSTQTSEKIIFQKQIDLGTGNCWLSSDLSKEIKSTFAIKEPEFFESTKGLSCYLAKVSTGPLAYIVQWSG